MTIQVAQEVFAQRFESISQYVDILANRGIEWGLLGPREVDRLWDRHVLNSVAPADLIPAGVRMADVGSGAGLPGIPLAILRTDLDVTLIEPLLRRSNFLSAAVDELGISPQVSVVRGRAEEHKGSYEVVTARAVAPLDRLVNWCAPLLAPGGMMLALKGSSAADEVKAARPTLVKARLEAEVLTVRAHAEAEPTTVVRLTNRRM